MVKILAMVEIKKNNKGIGKYEREKVLLCKKREVFFAKRQEEFVTKDKKKRPTILLFFFNLPKQMHFFLDEQVLVEDVLVF